MPFISDVGTKFLRNAENDFTMLYIVYDRFGPIV